MFKAFRIDEVFVMKRGKEAAPNRVPDGSYNMVNETSANNGITKKAYSENVFNGNSITVSVNYATTVFYQPEPYCASVNILILENENLDAKSAMYVIAMLRKNNQKYDYNHKISKDRLAETVLSYPVIESPNPDHEYTVDDIDWQYMRDRIAKLEQERIAELDAYLKVTGLDDYTLTDEDKKILSNATQHEFKEFKVKDVLNVEQSKSVIAKANLTEGDIPYVTRTVSDNGYMGTCGNKDKVNKGNCITIGAETGVAFYQPNDFVAGNKVYRLSREGLDMKEYLFLASVLNMQTKNYSYSNARIPEKIKAEKIFLPIIENSDPNHEYTVDDINWQYMERYIRTMEKVVVADVVRYKDRVIEETRKLVS